MKTVYIYFNDNTKLKLKLDPETIDNLLPKLSNGFDKVVSSYGSYGIVINWNRVNYIQIYD